MWNGSLVYPKGSYKGLEEGLPAERLGSACREMAKGWVACRVKVATPPRMTGRWPHHATCSMSTPLSEHDCFITGPKSCASNGKNLSTSL